MSIYERTLRVLSSDVDLHRRMRPSVLFRLVQEAAIAHTEELGMGREKTLDRGILWIVTLQSAEIRRMPEYDDDLVLRSWPGETMHVLFPRYFALDTAAGEPLVRASAIWTLLDAEKRSIVFAEKAGIRELYVPAANAAEAAFADRLTVYPVHDVRELIGHLAGETPIRPAESGSTA